MLHNYCVDARREDTEELEYQLSYDGVYYAVVGIGACTATEIVIAKEKNGIPVTRIASRAFENCGALTNIRIPDCVTDIEARAFARCKRIADMVVPNGVTCIAEALFSGCSGLKRISIPDSICTIEDGAFAGCCALKSMVLPNGAARIGDCAFDGCSSLAQIKIPNSLRQIGSGAFDGCRKLSAVHFQGTKDEWKAIKKEEGWNANTGNYTVHCTDGKIDKNGNEMK